MTSFKIINVLKNLALIFTIVPVVIIGLVGFFSMTGFSSGSLAQYARSAGKAQSEAINQCIGSYENKVELLAGDESVLQFADTGMAGEDEAKFLSALFDSIIDENYDIRNVTVVSADGTVILDHKGIQFGGDFFYGYDEDKIGKLAANQTYISQVMSAGTPYEGDIFFLARQLQKSNGERVGYIALTVGPNKLNELLSNTTYGDAGGYLVLSDGNDTVFNYDSVSSQRISSVSNTDIRSIFNSGANESGTVYDYEAGGFLGSYGYISGVSNTSWKWVSLYPSGAAISQIIVPIIISLLVMLAIAAGFVFLGRKIAAKVVDPINSMVTSIREVQTSNYKTRLDIDVSGELERIADLFNDMLDEVTLSEELHKTVSQISDNMLFEWDFAKEKMYLSENFLKTFDINEEEAKLAEGEFLDKLMDADNAEEYNKNLETLLRNRSGCNAEYHITNKSGVALWYAIRIMCVTDRLGEPLRIIGVITDVDNEKKMEMQLSVRASYDFLSQLYNRSTFEREFTAELQRNAHTKLCLLFVDVDDFKFINDRYGHTVGDEVIKFVATHLKSRVEQSGGFAGRFGGDEFILCITNEEQIDNVENLAMDMIDELYYGYESELAGVHINVRASIGISLSPDHGDSAQRLIAAADEAMYFVKKNGKANYHVYTPEDSSIEDLQHTL